MEKKICPVCNAEVDETLTVCQVCGASLENTEEQEKTQIPHEEASYSLESSNQTGENEQTQNETNEDNAVKSGKLVRFVAFFLTVVVLFFGGKFLWSNFGPGSVISVVTFGAQDVIGTYKDDVYGRYYTFKTDAKELNVKKADSSAGDEQISYDGTYETGFTKEYIESVLVNQYVIDNNLVEDYDKYITEKDLLVDDYNGYAKNKKITKEQLDKIDQEYQYVQMGNNYKTTGKWKYDNKAKYILLYDEMGNHISTLYVKREGLVADNGFMAGKTGFGKTFNSKFISKNYEYGITETISTYNDGMCISAILRDGDAAATEEPAYSVGTYRVKDKMIVFDISGEKLRYRQVTGGLGFMVYTK
ncbi:MAG: hypothetical protein J6R68_05230 [Clostridia bacterium]|nr:hypothetical protein [Clostridia bacterium]